MHEKKNEKIHFSNDEKQIFGKGIYTFLLLFRCSLIASCFSANHTFTGRSGWCCCYIDTDCNLHCNICTFQEEGKSLVILNGK